MPRIDADPLPPPVVRTLPVQEPRRPLASFAAQVAAVGERQGPVPTAPAAPRALEPAPRAPLENDAPARFTLDQRDAAAPRTLARLLDETRGRAEIGRLRAAVLRETVLRPPAGAAGPADRPGPGLPARREPLPEAPPPPPTGRARLAELEPRLLELAAPRALAALREAGPAAPPAEAAAAARRPRVIDQVV